jgi:hypothetical protein
MALAILVCSVIEFDPVLPGGLRIHALRLIHLSAAVK